MKNGWGYRLSTQTTTSAHMNKHKMQNEELPPFTPKPFLEYLVHFVIANDQVGLRVSLPGCPRGDPARCRVKKGFGTRRGKN